MELGDLAGWIRERLLDWLPNWLDFIPLGWPDWALVVAAPVVIFVVGGLILNGIFEAVKKSRKGFSTTGKLVTGRSINDPSPATEEGQAEIQRLLE